MEYETCPIGKEASAVPQEHLRACRICREERYELLAVAAAGPDDAWEGSSPEPVSKPVRRVFGEFGVAESPLRTRSARWIRWSAVAAAVLLAAGVLATVTGRNRGEAGGLPSSGDGVRLEWTDGTRIRWEGGPGRSRAVFLREGSVEAQVDPAGAGFEVRTEAGRVRVLGTRFGVRAGRISFPSEEGGSDSAELPIAWVRVTQGRVGVQTSLAGAEAGAGTGAVLLSGEPPHLYPLREHPPSSAEVSDLLGEILRSIRSGERSKGLRVWGTLLAEGERGVPAMEEVRDHSETPALRHLASSALEQIHNIEGGR